MKRLLRICALAALAALAFSACGSTPEDSGPPGTWSLLATGGTGSIGGAGGTWSIDTYSVKGVTISRVGAPDTSFGIPEYNPSVNLGSNPVTLASDTVVVVLQPGAPDPGANVLYVIADTNDGAGFGSGDVNLYLGTGGTGTVPVATQIVTGLRVNNSATLTIGLNWDADNYDGDNSNATGQDTAYITFSGDVEIFGTVQAASLTTQNAAITVDQRHGANAVPRDRGALVLLARQLFIRGGANIIATGGNGAAAGERGGDGGYIQLGANNYLLNDGTINSSGGNGYDVSAASATIGGDAGVNAGLVDNNGVLLQSFGVIINRGTIFANGGAGSHGGTGAGVLFDATAQIFNSGQVTANGGAGVNGNGGNAYQVAGNSALVFDSVTASVYNNATLSQKGGDGTANGGEGGSVSLRSAASGASGDVVNAGAVIVSGGHSLVSGWGGNGGAIEYSAFGSIRNSGDLTLSGGTGKNANNGGHGGMVSLQNYVPRDINGQDMPVRVMQMAGNIFMQGGMSEGATGGNGGTVSVVQPRSGSAQSDGGVYFYAFTAADLSGGDGSTSGGSAAGLSLAVNTRNDLASGGAVTLPAGPILNEIDISARGGKGTAVAGTGGTGGYIQMQTTGSTWDIGKTSKFSNSGKLDVSGGSGGTAGGGNSGGIYLYAHDGVTNSGELDLMGGDSTGGSGGIGNHLELEMYAGLDVTNSGSIRAAGGSGMVGGKGGFSGVFLRAGGMAANNSINATGGSGTVTNGNGGYVWLSGESAASQQGAIDVAAGNGAGAAGIMGEIWVDRVEVMAP